MYTRGTPEHKMHRARVALIFWNQYRAISNVGYFVPAEWKNLAGLQCKSLWVLCPSKRRFDRSFHWKMSNDQFLFPALLLTNHKYGKRVSTLATIGDTILDRQLTVTEDSEENEVVSL